MSCKQNIPTGRLRWQEGIDTEKDGIQRVTRWRCLFQHGRCIHTG